MLAKNNNRFIVCLYFFNLAGLSRGSSFQLHWNLLEGLKQLGARTAHLGFFVGSLILTVIWFFDLLHVVSLDLLSAWRSQDSWTFYVATGFLQSANVELLDLF